MSLLAAAYATPQGGYAVEKLPPKPFSYQYGVSDDYSKANFQKTESQDSNVRQHFLQTVMSYGFFFREMS